MVGTGTEKGGGDRASYRDPGTRRPARWRPKVRGEAGPRPAAGRSLGRCWKGGEALGRRCVAGSTCISPGARAERVVRSQVPTCASLTRRFRPLAYVFLFHIVRCVFLSSSFAESLCFLDTSLLRPLISKYFLLVYGLHFILVTILQNTRFLVLMRSNFVFFHLSITLLVS